MSIKVECKVCQRELTELGAILLSPPDATYDTVHKSHLCQSCFRFIENIINTIGNQIEKVKSKK